MSAPDIPIAIETLAVSAVLIFTFVCYKFVPYVPVNNLVTVILIGVIVSQQFPVVGTPPVCMYSWCSPWVPGLAQLAAQIALMLHVYICVLLRVSVRHTSSQVLGALAVGEGILIIMCVLVGLLSVFVRVDHVAMAALFTTATVLAPGLLAAFIPREKGIKDHPAPAPTWKSPSRLVPVTALALTASIMTVVVSDPDWLFVPRAPLVDPASGIADPSLLVCDSVLGASSPVWARTRVARMWWQILFPLASLLLARWNPRKEVPLYDNDDDAGGGGSGSESESEGNETDSPPASEPEPEPEVVEPKPGSVSGGVGATPQHSQPGGEEEASDEDNLRRVVSEIEVANIENEEK